MLWKVILVSANNLLEWKKWVSSLVAAMKMTAFIVSNCCWFNSHFRQLQQDMLMGIIEIISLSHSLHDASTKLIFRNTSYLLFHDFKNYFIDMFDLSELDIATGLSVVLMHRELTGFIKNCDKLYGCFIKKITALTPDGSTSVNQFRSLISQC